MRLAAILSLTLLVPCAISAPLRQDKDAKATAQDLLTKGAALFDTHDAAAMAETYIETAKLTWVEKDKDSGNFKVEVKDGRREIESLYRTLWKDNTDRTTSRNTVEYAKFVTPELLVIVGEFEPIVDRGKYSFVQERVKVGEKWLIQSLRLYIIL